MDQGKSLFRSNDVGGEETMLSMLLPGSSFDWSTLDDQSGALELVQIFETLCSDWLRS